MEAVQALMNFIFFVLIVGTIGVSVWMSRKYKERYAEFPWGKTALLIVIEVLACIIFNIVWSWFRAHPWIAAIVAVLMIVVLLKRKKKEEQIL